MFQINYCEYDRSGADEFRIYRPGGSGDYLFLLWKTPMKCCLDGRVTVTKENACMLYAPGFCQDYQAVRRFRNSYIHFSSDLLLEQKYGIPVNQVLYPENFPQLNQLIRDIQHEYLSGGLYSPDRLRNLTEELFIRLSRSLLQPYRDQPREASLHESLQELRLRMLTNCDQAWPINRLCQESHLGKSQFYYHYKAFFDSTPKEDLLEARMDRAGTLLTNEALQVQQVAQLCGFGSIPHFSRYFREWYHCPPSEYAALRTRKP